MGIEDLEIQAKIGGVQQVKADLAAIADAAQKTANTKKDVDQFAKAVDDAIKPLQEQKEIEDAFDELIQKQKQLGETVEQTGRTAGSSFGSISGWLKGLAQDAVGFIAGFAGFSAITRLFGFFINQLEQAKKILFELSAEANKASDSVHTLAAALPGGANKENFRTAEEIVDRIVKSSALERGRAIDVAAMIQKQYAGQGGIEANQELAGEISNFIARSNMQVGDGQNFIEVFKRSGLPQNAEGFRKFKDQMSIASKEAGASGVGEMAQIIAAGGGQMLGLVPYEQILQLAIQSRKGMPQPGQAESALRAYGQIVAGNKPLEDFMNVKTGFQFGQMNVSDRINAYQQVLGGKLEEWEFSVLNNMIPDRNLLAMRKMMSPKTKEETERAMGKIRVATGEESQREGAEWLETSKATSLLADEERARKRIEEGKNVLSAEELKKEAENRYKLAQGRGDVSTLRQSEESWIEREIVSMMLEKVRALRKKANSEGRYEDESKIDIFATDLFNQMSNPFTGYYDPVMTDNMRKYQVIVNHYGDVQNGGTMVRQQDRANPLKSPGGSTIGQGDANNSSGR